MKKVTYSILAKRCNVSKAAVSLAFNNPRKLSPAVREKIIQEAIALGYYYQKRHKISKVTLVFENYKNHFFGDYYRDIIYGITAELLEKKIDCQLLQSFGNDYGQIYESSGIIFVGEVPDQWIVQAKVFRKPFVLCGHPTKHQDVFSVVPDIKTGLASILEYIINCGHKRIGFITGEFVQDNTIKKIYLKTYLDILEKNGLTPDHKFIQTADYNDLQTIDIALHKLMSIKPRITAIQCADDQFAYQAIREAQRNGLKVPEDISICGFDGIELPWFISAPVPALTTIYIDKERIGRKSVELLLGQIENPEQKPFTELITSKLSIRDSVLRLKAKAKDR